MNDLYISSVETSQMNYTNDIHRMNKEKFLKLCSDFYDGNIEANKRKKEYNNVYDKFTDNYGRIVDTDNIRAIKKDVDELEEFLEIFLKDEKDLIEFNKKIKILDTLLTFVGESYKSTHDELWKMNCNGYVEARLEVEFTNLIDNSEFKNYIYKGNIVYRLKCISDMIIERFNSGDYMISKDQLSIIAKLIFNRFIETVDKIKEDIK